MVFAMRCADKNCEYIVCIPKEIDLSVPASSTETPRAGRRHVKKKQERGCACYCLQHHVVPCFLVTGTVFIFSRVAGREICVYSIQY